MPIVRLTTVVNPNVTPQYQRRPPIAEKYDKQRLLDHVPRDHDKDAWM